MAKDFAKEFYQSAAWKGARREALRRDLYTCRRCGGRATEVHHIAELTQSNITDMYVALGSDNLESLCHDCHTRETKKQNDLPNGYFFDENGHVAPRWG